MDKHEGMVVVTCVFCGHAFPPGTPNSRAQILKDHIAVCEEHPMKWALAVVAAARDVLSGIDSGGSLANGPRRNDLAAALEAYDKRAPAAKHWGDKLDGWTSRIDDAHPARSGSHETYVTAMQMVGNRHSKHALVELVNYLLLEVRKARTVQQYPEYFDTTLGYIVVWTAAGWVRKEGG